MGILSRAKPGYTRSKGNHHAKTRRRGYPVDRIAAFEGDPTDGIFVNLKFGKRGNAPSPRGSKKR